jgi:hypothetical protein
MACFQKSKKIHNKHGKYATLDYNASCHYPSSHYVQKWHPTFTQGYKAQRLEPPELREIHNHYFSGCNDSLANNCTTRYEV